MTFLPSSGRGVRATDAEHQLARILCSTHAARDGMRDTIEQLVGRVDFDYLASFLDWVRLLPLVGTRLCDDFGDLVPDSFHARTRERASTNRRTGDLLSMLTGMLVQEFEEAAIPVMPLKGSTLATAVYGDAGLRSTMDIDLLVRREDLERGVERIVARGWTPPTDPLRVDGLPQLHYHMAHSRHALPPVELHWRLHWYESRFSEDMLARARRGGSGGLRPTPDDGLVAALVFFARDAFFGLRLASDVAAWWDAFAAEITPTAVESASETYPELRPTLEVASLIAHRLVGLPRELVPASAFKSRRGRLAAPLVNWTGAGTNSEHFIDSGFVDLLLTPRHGGRAFVKRELMPPVEVIADTYHVPESARLRIEPLRIWHAAKLLLKYSRRFLALRARAKRPEPSGEQGPPRVETLPVPAATLTDDR